MREALRMLALSLCSACGDIIVVEATRLQRTVAFWPIRTLKGPSKALQGRLRGQKRTLRNPKKAPQPSAQPHNLSITFDPPLYS